MACLRVFREVCGQIHYQISYDLNHSDQIAFRADDRFNRGLAGAIIAFEPFAGSMGIRHLVMAGEIVGATFSAQPRH